MNHFQLEITKQNNIQPQTSFIYNSIIHSLYETTMASRRSNHSAFTRQLSRIFIVLSSIRSIITLFFIKEAKNESIFLLFSNILSRVLKYLILNKFLLYSIIIYIILIIVLSLITIVRCEKEEKSFITSGGLSNRSKYALYSSLLGYDNIYY